jgi:hypothetical protein
VVEAAATEDEVGIEAAAKEIGSSSGDLKSFGMKVKRHGVNYYL